MKKILFLYLLVFPSLVLAQKYIDVNKTLFGIEYSFQDENIVKEPGRTTMTTPYKEEKLRLMLDHYVDLMGLPKTAISEKTTWKPGYYVTVPNDGDYVINTEPVTIEFNTTPKTLAEIPAAAAPIYEAARRAGLKPYVNPAAERSGMGHIHIGGWTLGDSPFYRHENLLRNVLAFFHKHPSLLYGFAEAYDVGVRSNIETLHSPSKQQALEAVIKQYDQWAQQGPQSNENGLAKLVELFRRGPPVEWTPGSGFDGYFAHYRFINLEHLRKLDPRPRPSDEGKYTVEFRMFRPPPTAEHAAALAKMMIKVMDYLAKPGYLEPFERISPEAFTNFMSPTRIASDWEEVKKLLKIKDPLLDSMVQELVMNVQAKPVFKNAKIGLEIFEAYSEKEFKGQRFEVRFDAALHHEMPGFTMGSQELYFEKVRLGRKVYWIATVHPAKMGVTTNEFRSTPLGLLKRSTSGSGTLQCSRVFPLAG